MSWELTVRDGKKSYRIQDYNVKDVRGVGWEFYIYNEHDEGMSVSEINLFDVIDKYFKKEF